MKRTAQHHKRQRRLALALLPHIGLAFVRGCPKPVVIDMRSLTQRWISPSDADALFGLEHLWHIHTSVFLESGGQRITKTHEYPIENRLKQSALVDYLQDYHAEQIGAERTDQLVGFGWIATPHHRELSEAAIDRIYMAAVAATETDQ